MAGSTSSALRLDYSRRMMGDDDIQRLKRELPLARDNYPFEEVDFSQNKLSARGVAVVMEVCRRCPKLRVLKLYKNQIDDAGASVLAAICAHCLAIEEIHLSHNHFTAAGVETLIIAAEQARSEHMPPLWLRLEQNFVADAEQVFHDLAKGLSICSREDEYRCTARVCCKKMKVHLPFFDKQQMDRFRDRPGGGTPSFQVPGNAAVAGPSFRVPRAPEGPAASPSISRRPSTGTPKNGAQSPSPGVNVWSAAGGRKLSGPDDGSGTPGRAKASSVWSNSASAGYPAEGAPSISRSISGNAGAELAPPPAPMPAARHSSAPAGGAASEKREKSGQPGAGSLQASVEASTEASANSRASVVLDQHGRRRIVPKQLEAEDSSNQFICPLCNFVTIKPVMTSCSHLFCDTCFRSWVANQVAKHKKDNPSAAPVPLIPCPQPGCGTGLRKKDIMPMDQVDSSKGGAVQLLQRLRNDLALRCVHHKDHFKQPFGRDAELVQRETGLTCKWVGDLSQYEEHLSRRCEIERYLGGGAGDAKGDSESAAKPPPPPPKAGTSKAAPAVAGSSGTISASPASAGSADAAAGAAQKDGNTAQAHMQQSTNVEQGQIRVARYDFTPQGSDMAQIVLKENDLVKVFEVTDYGWAAGVRLCKDTMQEIGDAGWLPSGYLYPPDHVITK